MTTGDYLTIPGWVVELGLPASLRDCFAVVLRFSGTGGEGAFYGSVAYLAKWMGVSPDTARRALKKLVELGYITRTEQPGKVSIYQVADPSQFARGGNLQGVAICKGSPRNLQGVQEVPTSSPELSSIDNRSYKRDLQPARTREGVFDFRQALINAGVSADVADAWMAVRKTKKATNTQVAFEGAMREVEKTGASADQCIRVAAEQSWSGFRADWFARLQAPLFPQAPSPREPKDYLTRIRERSDKMIAEARAEVERLEKEGRL